MREWARGLIGGLVLAVVLVLLQKALVQVDKEYYLTQLTMSMYYAVVVLGLALLMGYAGQVSLGHGAFFAIGGYTTAILTTYNFLRFQDNALVRVLAAARMFVMKDAYGDPLMVVAPWAAFIAAMALTFVVSVVIGYSALRLKGHYLAMATLGFGLIVQQIARASTLTGASDGITGVPPFPLIGELAVAGTKPLRVQNYYIAGFLLLAVIVGLWNLLHSRVGRALQAIHDRETAANAMGINTAQYKLKAFVVSALLASVAGVLLTHYNGSIGPSEAGAMKSVRYVALAAAGGMGNIWAVAVTSISLNFLSLRGWFGTYDNFVFGVILITIISIAPEGPAKQVSEWIRAYARRAPKGVEDRDAAA